LTTISVVVVTGVPHPKVAVRRYLYVPATAIVSLKDAPEPESGVHTENPGPGALSHEYTGPDDAGVPVEAAVVFVMFTVPPSQIADPEIAPAL